MPKHIIPNNPDADRRLELNWQRDAGVQLATAACVRDEAGAAVPEALRRVHDAHASGNVQDITRAQDAYSAALAATAEPEWSAQFVDLTRAQVNHLIKQLRIARDQAFGRDE